MLTKVKYRLLQYVRLLKYNPYVTYYMQKRNFTALVLFMNITNAVKMP